MSDVRIVAALASSTIMLKVFDWLRLLEKTSFFIFLLERTLIDSFYFLLLFAVALAMFGFPMFILNKNRTEDN